MEKFFSVWFVVCAIAGLAWVAFLIWAGIHLVSWLVTK